MSPMCCEFCCTHQSDDSEVSPYRYQRVAQDIRDAIERFDFEAFRVSVTALDGSMDARIGTWADRLAEAVLDDIEGAVTP